MSSSTQPHDFRNPRKKEVITPAPSLAPLMLNERMRRTLGVYKTQRILARWAFLRAFHREPEFGALINFQRLQSRFEHFKYGWTIY